MADAAAVGRGTTTVADLLHQTDQVKAAMNDNIELAMANMESVDELQEKTELLENRSVVFRKQAGAIRRMECRKYYTIIAASVFVAVLLFCWYFEPWHWGGDDGDGG
eukprot:SAG22_NODE_9940_length_562_cov_1.185745_1_plen_107_part_00